MDGILNNSKRVSIKQAHFQCTVQKPISNYEPHQHDVVIRYTQLWRLSPWINKYTVRKTTWIFNGWIVMHLKNNNRKWKNTIMNWYRTSTAASCSGNHCLQTNRTFSKLDVFTASGCNSWKSIYRLYNVLRAELRSWDWHHKPTGGARRFLVQSKDLNSARKTLYNI